MLVTLAFHERVGCEATINALVNGLCIHLFSCKQYHHVMEVNMTSAWCVQCGYPTGSGLCLTCRGELPRSCANCDVDLPIVWYDILCLPCAEAEGVDYMADVQLRKERSAYLRACEDCGQPTYADAGPLCPICRFRREGFGFVVRRYPCTVTLFTEVVPVATRMVTNIFTQGSRLMAEVRRVRNC